MSAKTWRTMYVAFAWFFALFYLAVDVGSAISVRATLAVFNWSANLCGLRGAMGDPSDTVAYAFLMAYFMVLLVACIQCARDPKASGPLVLLCAGKATSGTTFLVLSLTVRPAYGFIFVLDVINIVMMVIPFRMLKKAEAGPA